MSDVKNKEYKLLDHGFIRVVDTMGDDSAIVQAARVSYGKGTKKVNEDRGLIRYLLSHKHTSPFEMCEIKFHVKMPIFVARQWIRHRTANVNEYSGRYSVMNGEFYIPELDQIKGQSATNKQGSDGYLPDEARELFQSRLKELCADADDNYRHALNMDEDGEPIVAAGSSVSRETARIGLPLNLYTEMYWKIDLHNLLHFLRLRNDPHAQYEIRVYAEAMWDIVKQWVPHTAEAFYDYAMKSVTLSLPQRRVLFNIMQKHLDDYVEAMACVDYKAMGLTEREFRELYSIVDPESLQTYQG